MTFIPKKIQERLISEIKKYQVILNKAKVRDVNESDTVIIITDILADVLGYNKYTEITSEFAIRNTYCDLATRIDGNVNLLIEVKAIGLDLKEQHVKQAIDYAANEGLDWVILTNGIVWQVYKVQFVKPIEKELVFKFDFLELNPKKAHDLELLYSITREGSTKSTLEDLHNKRQVLSKVCIGAMLISEQILGSLRRELKRVSPDVQIDVEQIKEVLLNEVIKREIVEHDSFIDNKKKIARASKTQLRDVKRKKEKITVSESSIPEEKNESEKPEIDESNLA